MTNTLLTQSIAQQIIDSGTYIRIVGATGTGKTKLAEAIANQSTKQARVFSGCISDEVDLLKNAIASNQAANCFLVIDEMDAMAKKIPNLLDVLDIAKQINLTVCLVGQSADLCRWSIKREYLDRFVNIFVGEAASYIGVYQLHLTPIQRKELNIQIYQRSLDTPHFCLLAIPGKCPVVVNLSEVQ